MNKVLILGASGLLGKSLVEYFVSKNFRVGALSRKYDYHKSDLVTTHAADILEYNSLEAIISKYKIVINCVGQITNPIYSCIALNSQGVRNIIDAVKKNNAYLVHLSTVSVYGSSSYASEDSLVNPESVYGSIKYFAEYQISQNLNNFMILRVSNLYGEGQSKGILAYIYRSFQSNKNCLIFNNNGSLKRYYLHINDLSEIIEMASFYRLKGVYNVIGEDFVTIKQLISLFEKSFDCSFKITYAPDRPIENVEKIDNSKLLEKINYVCKNNLETYLKGLKNESG